MIFLFVLFFLVPEYNLSLGLYLQNISNFPIYNPKLNYLASGREKGVGGGVSNASFVSGVLMNRFQKLDSYFFLNNINFDETQV